MIERKKYVDKIIAENSKNEFDEAKLEAHIGVPNPDVNLPNLRKDRIELELVNRTDEEQEIDLFSMPAGINPAQNINYGDLYETYYCKVVVPTAEIDTNSQTYTINWLDADGVAQSVTTGIVSSINELMFQLILSTNDNWSYYLDSSGNNYVVHKSPIQTFVY